MTTITQTTHYGTVVSVDGNRLTSRCSIGKTHHHTLARDALVTCDGKDCELADLKPGTVIRVTTEDKDAVSVMAIESGKDIKAPARKA